MKLLTAVGRFGTKSTAANKRYPVVDIDGIEHQMDIPEMLIWAAAYHRFLEPAQLRADYARRVKELGLVDLPDSSAYIDRLLQRGLLAEGIGDTGHDALFDLMSGLGIKRVGTGIICRFRSFIKLALVHRMPMRIAARALRKERLSACEKKVMELTRSVCLSVSEVIACVESGREGISSEDELVEAIYCDDHTTYDNISAAARACSGEQDCLSAIANLYLRKQIYFGRI